MENAETINIRDWANRIRQEKIQGLKDIILNNEKILHDTEKCNYDYWTLKLKNTNLKAKLKILRSK